MKVSKVYREVSKTIFIDQPTRRGSITTKAGFEGTVEEGDDAGSVAVALALLANKECDRYLQTQLRKLQGYDN